MDTGKTKNDYEFYEGYEGEPEIVFESDGIKHHFWEGYIDNIVGNPAPNESGWIGLTRDYNQFEGPFDDSPESIDVREYLNDLSTYADIKFDNDTKKAFEKLISIFQNAVNNNHKITIYAD